MNHRRNIMYWTTLLLYEIVSSYSILTTSFVSYGSHLNSLQKIELLLLCFINNGNNFLDPQTSLGVIS